MPIKASLILWFWRSSRQEILSRNSQLDILLSLLESSSSSSASSFFLHWRQEWDGGWRISVMNRQERQEPLFLSLVNVLIVINSCIASHYYFGFCFTIAWNLFSKSRRTKQVKWKERYSEKGGHCSCILNNMLPNNASVVSWIDGEDEEQVASFCCSWGVLWNTLPFERRMNWSLTSLWLWSLEFHALLEKRGCLDFQGRWITDPLHPSD